jgi:GH24 family phage-related lysozyme (muramidase)
MKPFSFSGTKKGLAALISASIALGAPITLGYEGMKLKTYYDSVGVKTWCAGETEIGYKEQFTLQECNELYQVRYGYYSWRTSEFYNETAKKIVSPEVHAAFTDMSYNIGLGAVAKSSMIKLTNIGQVKQACNAILFYKFAGGQDCSQPFNKTCRGVWQRRLQMHQLCMKGVK